MSELRKVVIITDRRAQRELSRMRDRSLPTYEFRRASDKVASHLAMQVANNLWCSDRAAVLVPILRAGLALESDFRNVFWRNSPVHHIGLERDDKTFEPKNYYPRRAYRQIPPGMLTIGLDPMNATGGSATFMLREMKTAGATNMILVNVIAAEEGIARVHAEFPDVIIYTAAVDSKLDEHKYIVPGLGDYGDRYFGTT